MLVKITMRVIGRTTNVTAMEQCTGLQQTKSTLAVGLKIYKVALELIFGWIPVLLTNCLEIGMLAIGTMD